MISLAVLMATYHADDAQMLDTALRSVFDQQLPSNHEVHVYLGVDGPIGPHLEHVIERYSTNIFFLLRSSDNNGLSHTLNQLLLNLGNEEYVFRMDADDFSLPIRFARQIAYLSENSDVDIVGSDIIEWNMATDQRRRVSYARDHEHARTMIARRVPVAHPTVCFRRRVFWTVPQYPTVNGNEDIAMWFNCLKAGLRFGNVPEPLLIFTLNTRFWKRRSMKKAFSEFSCYVAGIWALDGLTWRYLFPVARLVMRISPTYISKVLYRSKYRN